MLVIAVWYLMRQELRRAAEREREDVRAPSAQKTWGQNDR